MGKKGEEERGGERVVLPTLIRYISTIIEYVRYTPHTSHRLWNKLKPFL